MGKKLLLPTDFSRNSLIAIQYAIKLYANKDCDFYILNTYAKEVSGLDSLNLLDPDDAFNKLSEKRSHEGLGKILALITLENKNPKHRFHVLSRSTLFADTVKDVIERLQIDMLVMGAKGITNNRLKNYGKTAISAIENVRKCPVLIVPKNAIMSHSKEIVLTTDFKTDFNCFDIKHLAKIAKLSNASIQIVSLEAPKTMDKEQTNNKDLLTNYLNDIDHDFKIIHNVNLHTALSCFIEKGRSNMVSYINQKRTFWQKIGFGKSTLRRLGYFDDIPVLALNDK
ncbi:universal stress protein [Zobellia uliginosa]|uniref:universal stress protein n=1 Tax=Zobellia uliginosa TaxID=143224 RepID=UPI001C078930|nr:universal stress protein [Zobellia uliginosa]MBU2945108.1 universal stress protein [Zobellia uliginosa]